MNLPLRGTYTGGVAPKLRVDDLSRTVRRGDSAICVVDGVAFDLDPGEALGVTGPLDSGWRSLLRLIVGLDATSGGSVRLVNPDGSPLVAPPLREGFRQEVVLASALDPLLDRDLGDVAKWIPRLAASRHRRVRAATSRALRVAAGVDVEKRPADLSRSERLRLCLALAATLRPGYVLVEVEPSLPSADERRALADIILRMLAAGIGMIIGTRDERVLASVVGRVMIFEDGAVLAEGPPESVIPAAWKEVRRSDPA